MNADKIYAESIANQYAPKTMNKVVALKKLDHHAKRRANIFAYIFGTVSILVMGTGMSLSMGAIGSGALCMALGIVLGVLGMAGAGVNHVLYQKILEKDRAKYAYEIMQLAQDICAEAE